MSNRLAEYQKAQSPAAWWPAGLPGGGNTQQQMASAMNQATNWVTKHPELALTAAAVTGVILGWLIKRR